MFRLGMIGLLSFALVACGAEDDSEVISNEDLEPNNSYESSQVLNKSTQANQENIDEQVLSIHFDGSLGFEADSADYFSVSSIDKPGMYIVSSGWSSNFSEDEFITEYQMDIYVDGNEVFSESPSYLPTPSVAHCIYLNEGEKLDVSLTTVADAGKYTFHISYFGASTTYCDIYNGDADPEQPEENENYFIYREDAIDSTCLELEYFDSVYGEAALSAEYNSGTCIDAFGTGVFAYCDTDSNEFFNTKYYFKTEMTTSYAEYTCNTVWEGVFSLLDVVNPIDTDNQYYAHAINALGDGVCNQVQYSNEDSLELRLEVGSYIEGKCESTLGAEILIGYCNSGSATENLIQDRYVFSNNHTISEASSKCDVWGDPFTAF